jgi:hypothetical protein
MAETPLIITIDTEGDNLWGKPRDITVRNVHFLPRFQALCERFGLKPVYLANHEMASCAAFVEFGRDVAARGAGEIGMHLHAWNSPPLEPLTDDDFFHQPYLVEYPDRVMKEKIHAMTALLEERFGRKMVSHRAGRWAFDERYAALLLAEGYLVDCSVSPGVDWRAMPGDPGGNGGTDYTSFPDRPYFLGVANIASAAEGGLLEVPMTVLPSRLYRRSPWAYRVPGLRRIVRRLSPARRWLSPVPLMEKYNFDAMLQVARRARDERPTHMEFMLHSSELMPGGSPGFGTAADIDRLYAALETLFAGLATQCRGMTLAQFRDHWVKSQGLAAAPVARRSAGAAANENLTVPG